jgi:hypothetical protein
MGFSPGLLFAPVCNYVSTFLNPSARSRAIIGSLDTLVDIGVPAEKEVIQ